MQLLEFDYSLKNIPVCSNSEYILLFVARVSQFLRNFRWRAWHFLNPEPQPSEKECFGFKSTR